MSESSPSAVALGATMKSEFPSEISTGYFCARYRHGPEYSPDKYYHEYIPENTSTSVDGIFPGYFSKVHGRKRERESARERVRLENISDKM